jgi:hypothetical protein
MRPKNRKDPFNPTSKQFSDVDEEHKHQNVHEHESTRTIDDLSDLAKFGGDLIKRTVSSGFEVIKEGIPKEASQLIARGKEEVLKGLSKEMLNNIVSAGVDKVFTTIREHKLEISVRIKKDESAKPKK